MAFAPIILPVHPRPNTFSTPGALALLALLAFASVTNGCGAHEYCGAPGVVSPCTCADATMGARVCLAEHTLAACDCTGAVALPNTPSTTTGGMSGSGGTGATGGASSGGVLTSGGAVVSGGTKITGGTTMPGGTPITGGTSVTGGVGVTGGVPNPGGMDPTGGADIAGGAEVTGGTDITGPGLAYLGCPNGDECGADSNCILTASFPDDATVCAPNCVDVGDCPIPEGTYEAILGCVGGLCRFNCTPAVLQALLTCPTGMNCIAPLFEQSYCHNDGI